MDNPPIKTTALHLVDAEGKEVATLAPVGAGGGCGLWLQGPAGHSIEIVNTRNQVYFGLRRKGNSGPSDMAISLDADGPKLQLAGPDGTVDVIAINALRDALKGLRTTVKTDAA